MEQPVEYQKILPKHSNIGTRRLFVGDTVSYGGVFCKIVAGLKRGCHPFSIPGVYEVALRPYNPARRIGDLPEGAGAIVMSNDSMLGQCVSVFNNELPSPPL